MAKAKSAPVETTEVTETAEQQKARIAAEKAAAKKAEKEQADAAKAAAKAEKDKAKADAKAAKDAEKAARQSVKKNGVTRPNRGVTLRVWEIADEISKETKAPATRKAVTEKGVAEGLETGTIHTQYGRWRKFNGLSAVRGEAADKPTA